MEEAPERRHVAGGDGLDRRFELGEGRGRTSERVDVRGKLRPALKSMHAGDDELRVGKCTGVRSSVGRAQLLPGECFDLIDALIDPRTTIAIAGCQGARQAREPVGGPRTYRVAPA